MTWSIQGLMKGEAWSMMDMVSGPKSEPSKLSRELAPLCAMFRVSLTYRCELGSSR